MNTYAIVDQTKLIEYKLGLRKDVFTPFFIEATSYNSAFLAVTRDRLYHEGKIPAMFDVVEVNPKIIKGKYNAI